MGAMSFYVLAALTLGAIVICEGKPPGTEDIGTNFFLKASKSVPRIGRRDFDNFMKASKSIPRIGRRTDNSENGPGWFPRDVKRSFFEKYFKENEQPVWNDLEKIYQDYPGGFQGDEPYPGAGLSPKSDAYWPRAKKDDEILEDQPQTQK